MGFMNHVSHEFRCRQELFAESTDDIGNRHTGFKCFIWRRSQILAFAPQTHTRALEVALHLSRRRVFAELLMLRLVPLVIILLLCAPCAHTRGFQRHANREELANILCGREVRLPNSLGNCVAKLSNQLIGIYPGPKQTFLRHVKPVYNDTRCFATPG